jgi:hypothetical protein
MLFLLLLCCKWLYKITYLVFSFSCYETRNIFDEFVLYTSVRQDFLAFRRVCSETVRIVPRMLFSDISGVYVLRAEWSVWLETVCCVVLCMSHVASFVLWQPGAAQGSFVSYNPIF